MSDEPQNVAEYLLAGKDPEKAALLFLRDQYSYGELRRRVNEVSRAVLALGGGKGDRIVLVGESSFFWVAAYLGAMRAGRVCVPLSESLAPSELEYVLSSTEPRAIFLESRTAAQQLPDGTGVRVVTDSEIGALAGDCGRHLPFPVVEAGDLAALMFTSGSTGRPRGVMVSHGNILANTNSIIEYLRLTEADRILAILPFHYCFGASLLHTHLRVGGSLVIEPRFLYPEAVLQRMIDTGCTGFAGVPSHYQLLLRHSSLGTKRFPQLRYVQQAGGHLPPAAIQEVCAALPGVEFFVMYGQTEATARLSYLPPESLVEKAGSIGRGIPGVELRVVNEAGEEVAPGEIGEIVARGANVSHGYWAAAQETAETFRDGELRTGDLATVDGDGYIYVAGRARDFLKCGGERVSCRRLEEELLASGEVVEAAVIGIPDAVLGEAARAFVVPRCREAEGLEDRLTAFLKSRLASQFIPRRITPVSSLPKNTAGKVLKARLREAG